MSYIDGRDDPHDEQEQVDLMSPWRLAADLSISKATMLCAGINPSNFATCGAAHIHGEGG